MSGRYRMTPEAEYFRLSDELLADVPKLVAQLADTELGRWLSTMPNLAGKESDKDSLKAATTAFMLGRATAEKTEHNGQASESEMAAFLNYLGKLHADVLLLDMLFRGLLECVMQADGTPQYRNTALGLAWLRERQEGAE